MRKGVLKRDSDEYHTPAIVVLEIDTFGHFTTCDREEDGALAAVAGTPEVFERGVGLLDVLGLYEYQFLFENLVEDLELVPLG